MVRGVGLVTVEGGVALKLEEEETEIKKMNKKKICLSCKFPILNKSKNAVYCKECATMRTKFLDEAYKNINNEQNKIRHRKEKELFMSIDLAYGKDKTIINGRLIK